LGVGDWDSVDFDWDWTQNVSGLCGARDSDVVFAGIYFGGVEREHGGISFVP
jgi:hypothetical protein